MKVRDTSKRAILVMKNDVLRVPDLITITWENDCYLIDRGIRDIIAPSVTILIKVESNCTVLFWCQMGSQFMCLSVELNSRMSTI